MSRVMGRTAWALGRAMALAGGIVLVLLIVLTTVSVLGRMANTLGNGDWLATLLPSAARGLASLGPVPGDFEIVEAGIAFAIMAFFPWCQLRQSHATVDLFTARLPSRINRSLVLIWETVLFLALALIAWRIVAGTLDKHRYGETTFLLQFPVWWGYAACACAAIVAALVSAYVVWVRARELVLDRALLTAPQTDRA